MKTNSKSILPQPQNLPTRTSRGALFALCARRTAALCATAAVCLFSLHANALPGDLYVTDLATNSVLVFSPDGTQRTFASGLDSPQGIAFDQAKNLYVADASGNIYKYDVDGNQSTFFPPAGSILAPLNNPIGLTLDGSDLLVSENGANQVTRLPLDGTPPRALFQTVTAPLGISSHAFSQSGFTRYVAHENAVRVIAPDLTFTDVDLGVATRATAAITRTLVDGTMENDVFISTDPGSIFEIVDGSAPTTFASGLIQPSGMDFRPARFSGDVDRVGNLYVADTGAGSILMFTPDGFQSTFVTGVGSPNFLAFEVQSQASVVLLQNISTRAQVLTGDNVLIGGFIVAGADATASKTVVIRALGPSLANAGVAGTLANTVLELHLPDGTVTKNDDWVNLTPAQKTIITDRGLDQFAGQTISDVESILVATLPSDPAGAGYTAIVTGKNNTTGVGLVEVYDIDDPDTTATRLANLSSRGLVGTGDNVMIGGIIVGPEVDGGEVVLRAIGPSLGGVNAPLQDPTLELLDVNGTQIGFNDDWMNSPDADRFTELGLAPTDDAESAIDRTLAAGQYTAIVRGADDTTGVALIEAYHIPATAPAK